MSYQTFTTNNNRFPEEGPRTLKADLVFAGAESQLIDLMLPVQQKKITVVQGAFFNNVNGPEIEIEIADTEQKFTLAAGTQGVLQLLTTEVPRFTIKSSGAGSVRFHFVNFPVITRIF